MVAPRPLGGGRRAGPSLVGYARASVVVIELAFDPRRIESGRASSSGSTIREVGHVVAYSSRCPTGTPRAFARVTTVSMDGSPHPALQLRAGADRRVRHALEPLHRIVGRHDHPRGLGVGQPVQDRPDPELAVRRLEGHAGTLHEVLRAEEVRIA